MWGFLLLVPAKHHLNATADLSIVADQVHLVHTTSDGCVQQGNGSLFVFQFPVLVNSLVVTF